MGTICAMLFRSSGDKLKKRFFVEVSMFLFLVIILVLYDRVIFRLFYQHMPYITEVIPLILLLFCVLWLRTFGMPDRAAFQRYGALLGAICAVDLVAEIVIFQAVPTLRWIGNADILSSLLLISLCASLKPGDNQGGMFEPDQGRPFWRLLIIIGIMACKIWVII